MTYYIRRRTPWIYEQQGKMPGNFGAKRCQFFDRMLVASIEMVQALKPCATVRPKTGSEKGSRGSNVRSVDLGAFQTLSRH